jgi:hypothetical protein
MAAAQKESLEDLLKRDDGSLLPHSSEQLQRARAEHRAHGASLRAQEEEEALSQYTVFLSSESAASECVDHLHASVASLDAASSALSDAKYRCIFLRDSCRSSSSSRSSVKAARELEPAISELLDAPSIIEACAADGAPEDALAIDGLVNKLALAHSSSSLFASLAERTRNASGRLQLELFAKLRSPIQLPECLRVVGYLRRMHRLSESELRERFLECREEFLQSVLVSNDPHESAYDYLKRITDSVRVHVFDIAMQYRAIFSEDSSSKSNKLEASAANAPLFLWACNRVDWYLNQLQIHLPKVVDGASYAYLFEHCRYCGQSLRRVGLDFRSLLPPLFEECVAQLFYRSLTEAVDSFTNTLSSHTFDRGPSHRNAQHTQQDVQQNGLESGPPSSLLQHQPVAVYINGAIGALNELRQCPLAGLRMRACTMLAESLAQASEEMTRQFAFAPMSRDERSGFVAASKALMYDGMSHLVRCLGRVYHGAHKEVRAKRACEKLSEMLENIVEADAEDEG